MSLAYQAEGQVHHSRVISRNDNSNEKLMNSLEKSKMSESQSFLENTIVSNNQDHGFIKRKKVVVQN